MPSYDVIIVGLGAVGSAVARHMALRGQRVLGLDRHVPPHALGSSHGGSRIIRKAYFEGAQYLPLLERAYVLWDGLEETSGEVLRQTTGGVNIGYPEGGLVQGAQHSAEEHGLAYEQLSRQEVARRFPAFHVPDGQVAVWDPEAGLLYPERCIAVQLKAAQAHGADLHVEEPVLRWQAEGEGVAVTTAKATYHADQLVLCAGGWMTDLIADLDLSLQIEPQVSAWFRPKANAAHFAPSQCPIYIWEYETDRYFYGFPDLGEGVKVGLHHDKDRLLAHPDQVPRDDLSTAEAGLRACLRRLLPDADGPLVHAAPCFYTNTPDGDYLVDRHPAHPQVLLASTCSGHGFKASIALGEAMAELLTDATSTLDLDAFRLRSFVD